MHDADLAVLTRDIFSEVLELEELHFTHGGNSLYWISLSHNQIGDEETDCKEEKPYQ